MAYTHDTEQSIVGSWFGVTSANLETADRGDTGAKLSNMLDGTGASQSLWLEVANPSFPQEFVLDLGQNYTIERIRSRSFYLVNITDFDVYVSETNGDWGTAVIEGVNPTAGGSSYTETATTEKVGRYVRVVLNTSSFGTILSWGLNGAFGNCFDVFVGYSYDQEPGGVFTYNESGYTYNATGISYNSVDDYLYDAEPT